MGIGKGTNFFDGSSAVQVSLTDASDNAVLARGTVANLPSAVAGYAVSCLYQATDSGAIYENTGTAASCTFTLMDTASTSLQLPEAATDASTTTGTSLALTQNTVTTGAGFTQSLNGLTTGFGHSITHTTSVIANGGSLLNLSSTGIDTSTTTGVLLNLSSTASVAGTQILGTFSALTTGVGLRIAADALTTGQAVSISSASTGITGSGALLRINHTGTSTSNIDGSIVKIISAATEDTTIMTLSATGALAAGRILYISGPAVTTGTYISCPDANALTTGSIASLVSNSSDTTARNLVFVHNDHASAVGAVPLAVRNDAVTGTGSKFTKQQTYSDGSKTVTIWLSTDGTTPNGALTGTAGDICYNGPSSVPFYCTGTTNWTALA